MSYDSPRYRGDAAYPDEQRYRDEAAFRDDPSFRESAAFRESLAFRDNPPYGESLGPRAGVGENTTVHGGSYAPGNYPVGDYGTDSTLGLTDPADEVPPLAPPAPVPQYDDGPPRDRVLVHVLWELFLLVAVGAVTYLLYRAEPAALRGAQLKALFIAVAALGFVAVGMSLSLRAAVPNLSLGPLTYAAGMFFADNSDRGLLTTAGVTALLAIAVGVVIAVVVTALHVPSWAASLGAALGLIAWIQAHRQAADMVNGAYRPTQHALYWFAGFAALSVLGGVLGMVPSVRRAVGRFRPEGDPARRGGGAVFGALALVGSSALAATAGVLLALNNRTISPAENGVSLTGLALGAALLGGASVYGRRGGVLGTALAVIGLVVLVRYAAAEGKVINGLGLAGTAIGVGLVVSRLTETLGRSREEAYAQPAQPAWTPPPPADNWTTVPVGNSPDTWTPPAASGRPSRESWDDRWDTR